MNILERANEIVNNRVEEKDRQYGPFSESMEKTAAMASIITGKDLTAEDMYIILVSLKLSRHSYGYKEDSLLDAVAYLGGLNDYIIDNSEIDKIFEDLDNEECECCFNIPEDLSFSVTDIKDPVLLSNLIAKESQKIYNSPTARQKRTKDEIECRVSQGKVAELYLVENYGYKFTDKKYHDLIDKDGNLTEVKAYTKGISLGDELHRIRTSKWNKSKFFIAFKFENGRYTLDRKIEI